MGKLFNIARMTTATVGVGPLTLGSPVASFLSFAAAGVADGDVVSYAIEDGTSREVGTGTYAAAGTTLTRSVLSSTNGGAAIALSGSAQVFLTPNALDFAASAISNVPAGSIAATTVQAAIDELAADVGSQSAADYLVGTAQAGLSAEIVVGTSPGGELGGTWASPTVDASHSGSTHAAVQAAAEATAAAALATHEADTTAVHGITDTSTLYRSGGTDVAVADGGTGSSTAAGARTNLDVPSNAEAVLDTLFDANTVLKADSDNTPTALTMGASTILARLAAGNIVAATPAELRTLLALVVGTNVQAYDAELATLAALSSVANLTALSGLSGAANRLPYFTGSGAMALETHIPWTVVTKAADESVSSSTGLQDDDELSFATTSGAIYELELSIIYASPAGAGTPDFKVGSGEDTTVRGAWSATGLTTTDGQTTTACPLATNQAVSFGTAAANRVVRAFGWYVGGGGTFVVRWAQTTSDANATIVRAGSQIRYRRIV